jgi:type VI secretion system protein ImpF
MARIDHEIRITPSVLDRLIDEEPNISSEPPKSRSRSLVELKQSVRRDLEWLLNTRQYIGELDKNLEQVPKSVAMFGLPDFTGASAKSPSEQKRLIKQIETAVKFFEPRFLDVKITYEPLKGVERVLKFKIEARLDIEPAPEPIVFDTVLQLGSGNFEVKEK